VPDPAGNRPVDPAGNRPVDPAGDRPVDVVTAYLAALSAGDAAAAASWVTDDFVNEHTAAMGTSCRGRDAYRARLPGFLSTFAGLHYDVEDVVAQDDRVVVAYRMTATMRDDRGDHPIAVRGVFRFRVRDGLIAHRVDYWDSQVVADQLGTPDA
jgi:steroid delta-isomerase-like uncharacterized protein